jgi:putative addiction module CopG family antidote
MNISINEHNEERIKRKLVSGRYPSVDDVIAKALELLDEHDKELEHELADMHDKVRRGTEQADAGQLTPASEVFDRLLKRNAERTR